MQIEVKVQGQKIERLNSPGAVEDTLNYLTCHFTFDGSEWENTIKTAYFKNRATEKIYSSLIADDGTCTVPWEALTDKGFVRFSVAGERENYRITTGIESFYNSETVYGGQPSEPPTPSQYDQMIVLAEQTKEIAESVRSDADAGKFDGEPGKPGDPGKDGVSPSAKVEQTDEGAMVTVTDATGTTTAELKNGKDGNPGQDATDEQVQAAVDAYMEEHPVQVDTEDIIKLAIKNEASGAVPIVVTDSADMGVQDLEMRGWTEQDSYEGKNLLSVDIGQELTGIAVTDSAIFEEDGVHAIFEDIVSGEARDIYMYGNSNNSVESGYVEVPILTPGDYRIVNDNVGISLYVVVWRNGSSVILGYANNTTTKITVQDGDKFRIFLRCNIIGDTDVKIHPMIVKEGEDTTQYEPYTGGQPSPNPEYPQPITSAGKYNEETQKYEYQVKLTGNNLWNAEEAAETSKWVESTSQTGYSDFAIDVIPGQKVTVSFPEKLPDGILMYVAIVLKENGNVYKWLYYNTQASLIFQKQTVTALENKIWIRCNTSSIARFVSGNPYFQVEYGEERTGYQAYKEQTVTLASDRPLTKWDRLVKRGGQWGWVYKSNVLTHDGDENWIYDANNTRGEYSALYFRDTGLLNKNYSYCNKFRHIVHPYDGEGIMDSKGDSRSFYVSIRTDRLDTLDANGFKQWLQSNPLTVWYETKEETFVPLSESEQEALNALHTYYPTTMLSNDAGCEMTIKYIADTKAYIDNKVSAIQAAIVNTI